MSDSHSRLLSWPDHLPSVRSMSAYGSIAASLQVVERLRTERQADSNLAQFTQHLKRWQAARFSQTYADILQEPHMGPAAQFFLTELYSEQEFSKRDAQFARIATTLERMFPQTVVHTATLLAQLHALSESLDACMARLWAQHSAALGSTLTLPNYQLLWQSLHSLPGYAHGRQEQIQAALKLGAQLQRHTRVPGLRLMLKMMRAPATAAGLLQLQQFLERGFDTFAALGKSGKVEHFLSTIEVREQAWLKQMAGQATIPSHD
ncbi:MAG: hypothetical protein HC765_11135 [Brachymonas sp.]|nr:hypothetical protein [Brachymonas sp.]